MTTWNWRLVRLGMLCCSTVLLAVVLAGCKRSHESAVQGTVTYNGRPLPRGSLSFHPVEHGAQAYGTIQSNGSYEVFTGAGRGLAAGDYTVTVDAREEPTPKQIASMVIPASIIPLRYGNVKTTDLKCVVKPGKNNIDFELKP